MLTDIKVSIIIVTSTHSYLNNANVTPDNIKIIYNDNIHGRYIFIDEKGYIIDNSFNAIGKKKFVVVEFEDITKEMVFKGVL